MRTPKPSSRKKYIYLVPIIAVIVIAAVIYLVFALNKPKQNTPTTTNTPTSGSVNANKTTNTPSEGLPADTSTTTSDQVPVNNSLAVSITSFTQTGGTVTAVAKSSGSGTCVFTYKPADNGKPVTQQVTVTDNTCSTNIPEGEFTYLGNWTLSVTYYNNSQKIDTQKNVTIN